MGKSKAKSLEIDHVDAKNLVFKMGHDVNSYKFMLKYIYIYLEVFLKFYC